MHEGDEITYSIEAGRVVIVRKQHDVPLHIFTEWDSDADRRACAGL